VAGIVARCDARVGAFKAPANEEILGVVNLDFVIDDPTQGELNPLGVNCLRALRGRGLRVFGARTMSSDPAWRYVNVRRTVLTLMRWTEQNMTWVPFEPNTPRLWIRIQRELNVYLERLWRSGALQGAAAGEAFFVKCDAETNPPETREQGHVVTEIGLAPASPAEFIVVHVVQRAGSTQFS
jgi:phage tail sheath protein FI